jgi:hypothetical protein
VITGFNTDIEHDGVVYHVQTEDKGLESPLILSLVYSGGAILASKRSPYEDLIASGFDEEALARRLKRQHRLICAAINAGRIEELKGMSGRSEVGAQPASPVIDKPEAVDAAIDTPETPQSAEPSAPKPEPVAPQPQKTSRVKESPYTVYDSRRQSPLGEMAEPDKSLVVTVLEERELIAGQSLNLRILVENRAGAKVKPLAGISLSVKILGTTFRPQIYSVKTERDGVATVSVEIPQFNSGRAGLLIRATAEGRTTETRRVIYAAK